MVTFAPQKVIMDTPFTKRDILICRNLLIYLPPELQKRLMPLFHFCLNPDGVLFLGSSESVGAHTDLFAPLNIALQDVMLAYETFGNAMQEQALKVIITNDQDQ